MKIFVKNLKNLAKTHSQKKIAEDTKMSTASIANYINGISEPSASFLLALKNAYHINIDDFLTSEIVNEDLFKEINTDYDKFLGSYLVYYYNSSAYKGKVGSYNYDILSYGVISVYPDANFNIKKGVRASGIFMLERREAEKLLKHLRTLSNSQLEEFYSKHELAYNGVLEQNSSQVFITLATTTDKCMIILNNPPSTKKYIGGLGTVNSISRGREHVPCVQYVLFSKNIFKIPDGEIYSLLSLGISDVNIKNETTELIGLFKNLYLSEFDNSLTEYQKKHIIEDSISSIISDVANANMFRFAKVSNMEDDNYYRLIKDADNE